ncbi:uncharacterized protein LOC141720003 [Apium graveolens]|uniref:uncharacterized protein LOC141720003 n=1 Tax=Apium graveolens TaxID=4045 RepID=UPI003D796471
MASPSSYSTVAAGFTSIHAITALDVNHPYFLLASDNPGMVLTTVILTEQNYSQWRRSMEIALSSKLKLGFVDGTYVRSDVNSVLLIYWICCNNMVTSWILNSVSLDIAAHVIWEDLKVRYAQTNVPKLLNLRKELSHLTQGMMSITIYFTKFRTIHDELECLSAKPRFTCTTCTCTINSKLEAYDQTVQWT